MSDVQCACKLQMSHVRGTYELHTFHVCKRLDYELHTSQNRVAYELCTVCMQVARTLHTYFTRIAYELHTMCLRVAYQLYLSYVQAANDLHTCN